MSKRRLLYYITDRSQFDGNETERRAALIGKVTEAAKAGVDYIQLRERDLSAKQLEELARELVKVVRENPADGVHRTRLLINSRTDVAMAVGTDGVHLRSRDVSPRDVRNIVGAGIAQNGFVVAISCHDKEDVLRSAEEGADFAVYAPVFGKKGCVGSPPAGLKALEEACRVSIPLLALGGVTIENAAACFQAGAAGVAGIRLFQENSVEQVVRALRAI